MPMVTSQSCLATSTASRTQSPKADWSEITWSAANEPMTASGSRTSRYAAASPMAAIESRGDGSPMTVLGSSCGSWASTRSRCTAPVTIRHRSSAKGVSRSTVAWISDRPEPVRSCRNLGDAARDNGHSRVPAPPAGMTAQKPGMADMVGEPTVGS